MIIKSLPAIVRITKKLEKKYAKDYEKNRENLSKAGGASLFGKQFGVSKEAYVKKMVREKVTKMVDSIRGNEKKLTALVMRQKRDQVRALLEYNGATSEEIQQGNLRFVKKYGRQPLVITEKDALKEIKGYADMNQEEKQDAIKRLLAKDMIRVVKAGEAATR